MNPCIICAGENPAFQFAANNFRVVRCRKCGLVYLDPPATADDIKEFYDSIYPSLPEFNVISSLQFTGDLLESERILGRIERRRKLGKLLDVGCSYGYMLRMARGHGWETKGVESNVNSSKFARDCFGLDVFTGDLLEASLPDEEYDVVMASHVLEHVPNPYMYAVEVRRLLKKGGLFIVRVPNVDGRAARATREYWSWMIPPSHLFYFSPRTLKMMLEKAGFQRIESGTWKGYAHNFTSELMLGFGRRILRRFYTQARVSDEVVPFRKVTLRSFIIFFVDLLFGIVDRPLKLNDTEILALADA